MILNQAVARGVTRAARLSLMGLIAVAASGCSTLLPAPPPETIITPQDYDAAAQSLATWTLRGRVAVNHDGQGWTATLRWGQQRDDYHIDLSGPFGQGAAQFQGNGEHMRAQLAGEEFVREGDPSELMYQVVGWDVPVASLRYWVLGLADPSQPAQRRWDAFGRPAALDQMGWTIEYTRHREDTVLPLPTRLTATRGDWRFKLIVDEWIDQAPQDDQSRTDAQ